MPYPLPGHRAPYASPPHNPETPPRPDLQFLVSQPCSYLHKVKSLHLSGFPYSLPPTGLQFRSFLQVLSPVTRSLPRPSVVHSYPAHFWGHSPPPAPSCQCHPSSRTALCLSQCRCSHKRTVHKNTHAQQWLIFLLPEVPPPGLPWRSSG